MPIYKDDDYTWYRSKEWDAQDRMARGEISITGKKLTPPIKNKGLNIYTIKDVSGLTEAERKAIGVYHLVEVRDYGDGKKYPMYSGMKINGHRGEPNHYPIPEDLIILAGTSLLFTPDGRCRWTEVAIPDQFNSLFIYFTSIYKKIWGSNLNDNLITIYHDYCHLTNRGVDRFLRQRKKWAGERNVSAASIKKYPWYYLFTPRWRFIQAVNLFATVHAYGVMCNVIKPGQVWEKTSSSTCIFQEPVMNLSLSVGVPKWLKPGDYEGLLRDGLVGEIRFMDSGFPSSPSEARLFELFAIGLTLLGTNLKDLSRNNYWRQFLGAIESPTTGVFRFPLLKNGGYLGGEKIARVIRSGRVKRLRLRTQNISIYHNNPDYPISGGFPSNVPYVEVPIGEKFIPDIKYRTGESV